MQLAFESHQLHFFNLLAEKAFAQALEFFDRIGGKERQFGQGILRGWGGAAFPGWMLPHMVPDLTERQPFCFLPQGRLTWPLSLY